MTGHLTFKDIVTDRKIATRRIKLKNIFGMTKF